MSDKLISLNTNYVKQKIFHLRGVKVILDSDLAKLYAVETRVLKQSVKRNISRFPEDFMFQLTLDEVNFLVSQFVIPSKKHLGGVLPYVFTEQGVASLSAVLRSKIAINIHVKIIRAFTELRRFSPENELLFQKILSLEQRQDKASLDIKKIFQLINSDTLNISQGIFYEGQVFDSYEFVSRLIKSAKSSLILVDNYLDESVLTLLSKKRETVSLKIYTRNITKSFELDVDKFISQYGFIDLNEFNLSHDRFLIVDDVIYHFGASLKDLGKKWFAFSKLNIDALVFLRKLGPN